MLVGLQTGCGVNAKKLVIWWLCGYFLELWRVWSIKSGRIVGHQRSQHHLLLMCTVFFSPLFFVGDRLAPAAAFPGGDPCRLVARRWGWVLVALMSLGLPFDGQAASAEVPLQRVVLQLKWNHAFQFAGYYAALHLGLYRDVGLAVELREGGANVDVVAELLQDRAQFGVGTSSLLLDRQAGKPVVVLGVVFQHSPLVLIARQHSPTQTVQALANTRVMLEPHSEELMAYLQAEGRLAEGLTPVPHTQALQALQRGEVEAISGYSTYEPYFLRRDAIAHHVYSPRAAGIDFYGDNLFTTDKMLQTQPEVVERFRAASMQGWQYAMAHPDEVMEWLHAEHAPGIDRKLMVFESEKMAELIRGELVAVGYMHTGRWQHMAEVYQRQGMLPGDIAGVLAGLLYVLPGQERAPTWSRDQLLVLAGMLVLLGLVAAVAEYVRRVNHRLRHALVQLGHSEQRHRLLGEHTSDVIWTLDAMGRFTYISPSVQRLRGYTVPEVMAQTLEQALAPESAARVAEVMAHSLACLAKGQPVPEYRGELEQPCKGGGTVWTEQTVTGMYDAAGAFTGFVGVARDITERRQTQATMAHMAQYDHLTQLPNRGLLQDRLTQALARAQRMTAPQTKLALLFVDLDKFKPVNDQHGHAVGDRVLQVAAQRMLASVRASDTVARTGGDEFVVLLPEVHSLDDALLIANNICHALSQPYLLAMHNHPDGVVGAGDQPLDEGAGQLVLVMSSSVGVALYPDHAQSPVELMRLADQAMYAAKQSGRNQVGVAKPTP